MEKMGPSPLSLNPTIVLIVLTTHADCYIMISSPKTLPGRQLFASILALHLANQSNIQTECWGHRGACPTATITPFLPTNIQVFGR
jgi:hypothetical protein